MKRRIISAKDAPSAVGPYSQAVATAGFVFISGQIPLDPATGRMVEGDIAAQTERVMANLGAVLEAAGLSFADVVKTTIYLADIADFAAVNEVYGRHFPQNAPARATVQVAALPKAARIEVDAIAAARG
jgi:2-iminobutanoate/2-iminopropanoate deaminase